MSAAKICVHCSVRPVDKGATRYCAECKQSGKKASAKTALRKPCRRCGQPKGDAGKGARFCSPCKEVLAPVSDQYELDLARQRERQLMDGRRSNRRSPHAPPDGQKWCTRCERFLPLTSFPKGRGSNGKVGSYCVPCQRSYSHARNLRATFGMTPEDYATLYEAQAGRCAICLRRPRTTRLAVDHNHATDEIRGLLCYRCNKNVLGNAMESSALLRRAANYLEEPPARTGKPLESLEHYEAQADHIFAKDAEDVEDGHVVVNPSGELVAVTMATLAALTQVAGFTLTLDGETFAPSDQMSTEDLALVQQVWTSYQRQIRGAA